MQPVTRGRMAQYLVRALHLTATGGGHFTDVPKSNGFATSIDRLATAGLAIACASGKFCPDRKITRAETAGFLALVISRTAVTPPPPTPGNPDGGAPVPAEGQLVDTSSPDHVVGTGTPASCTGAAVVAAVAQGGIITFDCGPDPVTIHMTSTAKVFNDQPDVVIDGGGRVTLDGQGVRRILYQNTCDQAQHWTTDHCQDQPHPVLTVQRIVFANGKSSGAETMDGGGAIFVRGGRLRVIDSQFYGNRCNPDRPGRRRRRDPGLLAVPRAAGVRRAQHVRRVRRPAQRVLERRRDLEHRRVVDDPRTACSRATRRSARARTRPRPARPAAATAGPSTTTATRCCCTSRARASRATPRTTRAAAAIFFVSNDRSGSVEIVDSILRNNTGDGFKTYPGIFFLGASITFPGSTVE